MNARQELHPSRWQHSFCFWINTRIRRSNLRRSPTCCVSVYWSLKEERTCLADVGSSCINRPERIPKGSLKYPALVDVSFCLEYSLVCFYWLYRLKPIPGNPEESGGLSVLISGTIEQMPVSNVSVYLHASITFKFEFKRVSERVPPPKKKKKKNPWRMNTVTSRIVATYQNVATNRTESRRIPNRSGMIAIN